MTNPSFDPAKHARAGDGTFTEMAHTEAAVKLGSEPGPASAADIIAAGTSPVSLRFVHYDDQLTKDQMTMILEGDWNGAENDVDEAFSEGASDEAGRIAESEINAAHEEGAFDREWDDLDEDEQNEARYAVEARDDSDPVKDLLRTTPPQLMRTSLGQPAALLSHPCWASGDRQDDTRGFEARRNAIEELLKKAGVDTDVEGVPEAIEDLVTEGPFNWHEGVQLDVIFYGPIEDSVPAPRSETDCPEDASKVLEFAKPHVLLIDKYNGSGYDTVLPSPLKRTLVRPAEDGADVPQTGRVYLDDDAGGYSWDDVCGLVKSAYGGDGAPKASWVQAAP
jgi:hypothetical protein